MDRDNTQPIALITGASQGIGKAMAHYLANKGFKLALLARNKNKLLQVAQELHLPAEHLLILDIDVTDYDKVEHAINKIITYYGKLDVALLNHGIYKKSFFNKKKI